VVGSCDRGIKSSVTKTRVESDKQLIEN